MTAGGVAPTEEPDDVAAERQRVEGLGDYEANPIVVRHLNKTYPGLDGQPPKVRGGSRRCGRSTSKLVENYVQMGALREY
jgi:hypothetical protein